MTVPSNREDTDWKWVSPSFSFWINYDASAARVALGRHFYTSHAVCITWMLFLASDLVDSAWFENKKKYLLDLFMSGLLSFVLFESAFKSSGFK